MQFAERLLIYSFGPASGQAWPRLTECHRGLGPCECPPLPPPPAPYPRKGRLGRCQSNRPAHTNAGAVGREVLSSRGGLRSLRGKGTRSQRRARCCWGTQRRLRTKPSAAIPADLSQSFPCPRAHGAEPHPPHRRRRPTPHGTPRSGAAKAPRARDSSWPDLRSQYDLTRDRHSFTRLFTDKTQLKPCDRKKRQ